MKFARLTSLALSLTACAALAPVAEAKVTSSFANQILTLRGGDPSERVAVTCNAAGNVQVDGSDPDGGVLPCTRVTEVDALMGAGNDHVDLSGVGDRFGQGNFPGFGQGTGAAAALGPGHDSYVGAPAAFNLVLGGAGNDREGGGAFRDNLTGGAGNDVLAGGGGNDLLLGKGGADTLGGRAGDDLLSGNSGNDLLNGGSGGDILGGGLGADRLRGSAGPDRLLGGAGKDHLSGGGGHNTLIQDSPKKGKKKK